jgi:histidinol-phosphate/aromatic aminotransferase/cobyric acid decarboxylase-like protein
VGVDELEKVLLPYALSVPTQLAGTIALDFHTDMEKRVAALVEEARSPLRRARGDARPFGGFRPAPTSCWCA